MTTQLESHADHEGTAQSPRKQSGPVPRFMRVEEVAVVTGLSRATIYKYVADGTFDFPRQVRLGPNRAAWVRSEIEGWIEARKEARVAEAA